VQIAFRDQNAHATEHSRYFWTSRGRAEREIALDNSHRRYQKQSVLQRMTVGPNRVTLGFSARIIALTLRAEIVAPHPSPSC
jgi:hypothetical protein